MKSIVLVLFCVVSTTFSFAQTDYYWVTFTDKDNSPYSNEAPEIYLSQKAIDRRAKRNIPITSSDWPPNPAYVQLLRDKGGDVRGVSKWMNAALITSTDTSYSDSISGISVVQSVEQIKSGSGKTGGGQDKFGQLTNGLVNEPDSNRYGPAYGQIRMVNGDLLHELGYTGEGMTIAVLDGGFRHVNTLGVFDSLFISDRVLTTYSFVHDEKDVYRSSFHGSSVLSVMAANTEGEMIGTAPGANYILLLTEDVGSETRAEEAFWVLGAEFADSLGADIFNTSLGYSTFDDPNQDYTYADMDGNTALITRAADMAASKGIIVVNSAGNAGASNWHYITAPADGDSVFTVGAVNINGVVASFSSRGPNANGLLKPNVCAVGRGTVVINAGNQTTNSNGTSFSSPLIAGMAACLWQAFPEKSSSEIMSAIERSGDNANLTDTLCGYGIPNFYNAWLALEMSSNEIYNNTSIEPVVYPTHFNDEIQILFGLSHSRQYTAELFDMLGRKVIHEEFAIRDQTAFRLEVPEVVSGPGGAYILRISDNLSEPYLFKLVKQ